MLDVVPESIWPGMAGLLNREERERAAQFAFERHRREYIAAHALKRLMLSALEGFKVAPKAWSFETASGGKPRVDQGAGPYFNLSHCDGLVACAVSRRVELGLDVECLTRDAPLELARSHFTCDEGIWLRSLPAANRSQGFYRLWTLKEAYVKAVGLGLAQPLRDFSINFQPLCVTFHDASLGDPRRWRFYQRAVGVEHMLALAWQANEQCRGPIKYASFSFNLPWGSLT